jgi:hemolysin III
MERVQSRAEIWADGIVHVVGLALGAVGAAALALHVATQRSPWELWATILYGATLLAMLAFSLAYNMVRTPGRLKTVLRRFDHAGIYLLIAGTYTPMLTQLHDTRAAWLLGATVWIGAVVGILLKFALPRRFGEDSALVYLALAWVAIIAYEPIMAALPAPALVLLLAGGLVYSAGVVFHLWERLKFQRAIWHGFVVTAAVCHLGAIAASMGVGA